MNVDFVDLFFVSFLAIAAVHGFLAGWTKLLYRKKATGQLSSCELRVKQGTASLEHRVTVFTRAFFASLFTFQVYFLALCCAAIAYLLFGLVAD